MTIQYVTPKNTKELNALIADCITYAKTMQQKVQITAVAILMHAEKHGDWTKANDLVKGLPDGVKRDALVEYFVKLGGLTTDDDGFNGWSGAEFIRKHFDQAKAKMWWTFKKASPFAGFNLDTEIEKLIQRAQDAQTKRGNWLDGDSDSKKQDAEKILVDNAKLKALRDSLAVTDNKETENIEPAEQAEQIVVKDGNLPELAGKPVEKGNETKALAGHYQPVAKAA